MPILPGHPLLLKDLGYGQGQEEVLNLRLPPLVALLPPLPAASSPLPLVPSASPPLPTNTLSSYHPSSIHLSPHTNHFCCVCYQCSQCLSRTQRPAGGREREREIHLSTLPASHRERQCFFRSGASGPHQHQPVQLQATAPFRKGCGTEGRCHVKPPVGRVLEKPWRNPLHQNCIYIR